jgi:REP element-mobilizing transposase RayT
MNRGANSAKIYYDKEDYTLFLTVLKEACNLFNVTISAYCLMTNHYHILANTPEGNISRFMRHVNGVYTQRHNRKHKKDGPLFRGRFKSVLVQEDMHLVGVVRYIHLNPIKAKMIENIKDFKWSSHSIYLKGKSSSTWIDINSILYFFSKNKAEAIKEYKEYISQDVDKEAKEFYSKKNQSTIFGDNNFIEKIKEFFIIPDKSSNIEIREKRVLMGEGVLQRVNMEICRKFGVSEKKLHEGKRGEENIARLFAITLARELSGLRMPEIAEHYKIASYRTVGTICFRFSKRMNGDDKLRKQYNLFKHKCSHRRT